MEPPSTDRSRPWTAAELLQNVEGPARDEWRPDELADILKDQLATPPTFYVTNAPQGAAGEADSRLAGIDAPGFRTFGELLSHPAPPLHLLHLTKNFARDSGPNGLLPNPIATLLYYAAIAVALNRHGELITQLGPDKVRFGFDWALRQAWVDPATRQIFLEAAARLGQQRSP